MALANPTELPEPLRPRGTVGHHLPISPYRRRNIDRVELSCYTGRSLLDGTLPDRLVYLSVDRAGDELRARIDRQFTWLERLLDEEIQVVDRFVGTPGIDTGLGWSPHGIESVPLDRE